MHQAMTLHKRSLYLIASVGAGRALFVIVLLVVWTVMTANGSVAYESKPEPTSNVVMPNAGKTTLLVRTALLTLNNALQSGNYAVLRDTSAPGFREANSPAKLARTFASLEAQNLDLSAVAIMVPQLTESPVLENNEFLHIKGYFPGQPVQINFSLTFQVIGGSWRLFGLSVNPVTSSTLPRAAP